MRTFEITGDEIRRDDKIYKDMRGEETRIKKMRLEEMKRNEMRKYEKNMEVRWEDKRRK